MGLQSQTAGDKNRKRRDKNPLGVDHWISASIPGTLGRAGLWLGPDKWLVTE